MSNPVFCGKKEKYFKMSSTELVKLVVNVRVIAIFFLSSAQ